MAHLLRISILGTLPTGEEWSTNPCYQISDFGIATTPAQVQAVANAVIAVTPTAALLQNWAPGTQLVGARVEARKWTGELENQAEATRVSPANGTGTVIHPFQTAWVTSLRTVVAGPSGRGRLYWPATGIALGSSSYRPSLAQTTNTLAAVGTYLGAIQTAVRVTFAGATLTVWSRKGNISNQVVSLQMGDILDTQRRRRDTLIEAYSSQAYP